MPHRHALRLLLAVIVAGCAPAPETAEDPPAPSEVEAVVADFYARIGTADYAGLETLTTEAFEAVDGGRRMDFPAFRAFLVEVVEEGVELDFALDRFHTVVAGEVAYTTLLAVNRPLERAFHESVILRWSDGAWRVDRFHSTPVRE